MKRNTRLPLEDFLPPRRGSGFAGDENAGHRGVNPPRETILEQFFLTVYRPLRLRGRSEASTRLHLQSIKRFSEYLGRPATLSDLNDLTVAGFLEHRRPGHSPYTVERERTSLLALWRFACRRGLIREWPDIPPAPLPRRIPTAWTVEQMSRLFDAARTSRGWVNGIPAGEFWTALIAVLWETGERVSAVMSARAEDYRRPYLTIRAEGRKGKAEDVEYQLTDSTCHRLELAMRHGHETIFFWPYNSAYLWQAFKRVVERAGLPAGRQGAFHQIRRSAASHLAAAGGSASDFLHHSNPALAKRWYLAPSIAFAGRQQPSSLLPRIDRSQPRPADNG